jgi:methyl-accepting chemotaxis protein
VILANDAYKDTTRTRAALTRAYSALKENNVGATRDAALKSVHTTIDRADTKTASFAATSNFAGQDDVLKRDLVASSNALASTLKKAFDALQRGDTDAYVVLNSQAITAAGAAYSANLEKFQDLAESLAKNSATQGAREYGWVVAMVVIGVFFALALIVAAHFVLRRNVISPLQEASSLLDRIAGSDLAAQIPKGGTNEVGQLFNAMTRMQAGLAHTVSNVRSNCEAIHGGAREIAAGNLDLSSRTEQQAASLEETAASMEELTSTVKQNADNARQANTLAENAADIATRGGEVVKRAVQTMTTITANSQKIADITGMIDSIAFQTNILALNAAVESARAGEQGRGFAVVAGEVRTLAQRSASAAHEIKALIAASVDDIRTGNTLVTQAGQTMSEIVGAVQGVGDSRAEPRHRAGWHGGEPDGRGDATERGAC